MISYEKLFELLKEKNLNKNYLRNNGLTPTTVDYLIHNKEVNKLCNLLNCTPNDIMTFTPDKED